MLANTVYHLTRPPHFHSHSQAGAGERLHLKTEQKSCLLLFLSLHTCHSLVTLILAAVDNDVILTRADMNAGRPEAKREVFHHAPAIAGGSSLSLKKSYRMQSIIAISLHPHGGKSA